MHAFQLNILRISRSNVHAYGILCQIQCNMFSYIICYVTMIIMVFFPIYNDVHKYMCKFCFCSGSINFSEFIKWNERFSVLHIVRIFIMLSSLNTEQNFHFDSLISQFFNKGFSVCINKQYENSVENAMEKWEGCNELHYISSPHNSISTFLRISRIFWNSNRSTNQVI